jgi:hypothetical protein
LKLPQDFVQHGLDPQQSIVIPESDDAGPSTVPAMLIEFSPLVF